MTGRQAATFSCHVQLPRRFRNGKHWNRRGGVISRTSWTTSAGERGAEAVIAGLVGSRVTAFGRERHVVTVCMTRLCLGGRAAILTGAMLAKTQRRHFKVAAARSSSILRTLGQHSSITMQALTSSFPSSNRSRNGVQLDNIIFYSGPASTKTRGTTPIDADEWPDVDMIFAEVSQQELVAATEPLDPPRGFNIQGEGEPCPQLLHRGLPSNTRGV